MGRRSRLSKCRGADAGEAVRCRGQKCRATVKPARHREATTAGPPHAAAHGQSSGHARPLPYPRRPASSKRRSHRARTTDATGRRPTPNARAGRIQQETSRPRRHHQPESPPPLAPRRRVQSLRRDHTDNQRHHQSCPHREDQPEHHQPAQANRRRRGQSRATRDADDQIWPRQIKGRGHHGHARVQPSP